MAYFLNQEFVALTGFGLHTSGSELLELQADSKFPIFKRLSLAVFLVVCFNLVKIFWYNFSKLLIADAASKNKHSINSIEEL